VNISNIIANPNSPSGFLNPAGFVFVIRCVPDIFTREQINIGVCAVSSGGQRKVKVITEAGRLSCFYGDSAINVVMLAQAAAEAAMAGAQSPSPQVVFDDPTPYFNSTLDDVVFSTFADQVTAAIPYRVTGATESISDEVARQRTIDAIKTARGLDVDFVANTPLVLLNTDSGPRPVYIPLQARRAVGTIRSSAYGPDSLKMHLLESVLDMEAAQRWRNMPAAGLFILRPPGKDKKHETAVERVIDAVAWRCNKSLAIEMEPTPERLAIKIVSWAETHS
jgi:hypothetical protein